MTPRVLYPLLPAALYAILPYVWALHGLFRRTLPHLSAPTRATLATSGGVAALFAFSTPIAEVSLEAYVWLHHALTAILCVAAIVRSTTTRARHVHAPRPQARWILFLSGGAALLALTFASRVALVFADPLALGGGDAQFHNILAQATLLGDRIPATWMPVADLPVMYPRGVHVVAALTARLSGRPVHEAIQLWLCLCAVLTTALIDRSAAHVFRSRASGLLAATAYAFLALWGSLDYVRWTGLPNAVGMQMNLLVALCVMLSVRRPRRERLTLTIMAGVAALAVTLTHHYSLIVTGLFLVPVALLSPTGALRSSARAALVAAGLLCVFPVALRYAPHLGTISRSGVLAFNEAPMLLVGAAFKLGIGFAIGLFLALGFVPGQYRGSRYFPILAWFTALVLAFVVQDYLYRFCVYVLTGGASFHGLLTPGRMLTNLVYPGSVLIGGLARWRAARRRPWAAAAVVALAAALSFAWHAPGVVPPPYPAALIEAAAWMREQSSANAIVVGWFHQSGYLTWRRQQFPPLPASEARETPPLPGWRGMRTLQEWWDWDQRGTLIPYFWYPSDSPVVPGLRTVFSNELYSIRTFDPPHAPRQEATPPREAQSEPSP